MRVPMIERWLTFDIGCIECGEESAVVGVYPTREAAQAAADGYTDPSTPWGRPEWHGQHAVEVFALGVVADA